MNKEEKVEYLKRYRVLQAKINRIEQQLKANPKKSEEYLRAIEKAEKMRDSIEGAIEKIDDGGIMSEVLFQKYIMCNSFEHIGREINYSKRQIERYHHRALEKLDV